MKNYLFTGQVVHSKSFDELELFVDGFVAVKDGKVAAIGDQAQLTDLGLNGNDFVKVELTGTQFLIPGLIDCHIHAPQMPNIGLGLDMGLLDWLDTYTFPLESKYQDEQFAKSVFEKVIARTLKSGTTFACYFGTNFKNATLILAEEAVRQGQRALVGKVSANKLCPDYYRETTEGSVKDNIDFIEGIKKLNSSLVQPVITPRFAPSCDEELMKKLHEIAKRDNLHIQSHISESLGEIEMVQEVFKKENYASVYDSVGLLTNKCIMAHGVHLTDKELDLFKARGTSVAHCPTSNTNLRSGLCDVKRILERGVKVGLGTDVSGGSSASILVAMKDALDVSHHLNFVKKQTICGTGKVKASDDEMDKKNSNYEPMNYKNVLYLATLGGAEALAMDKELGNFEVGKSFDALVVDVAAEPIDKFEGVGGSDPVKRLLELVQKFVYVGDDRNIGKVFVEGVQVV